MPKISIIKRRYSEITKKELNDTSETYHYFVIYYMKTIVITILLFMGCSLTGYAQGVQGTKLKKQENNNMKDQKEIYFAGK